MSRSKKLLVVAASGWGKTRLAGSSPGNVLFLRPPVDHVDSVRSVDRPRCKEIVMRDWNDVEEVEEYLRLEGKNFDWVWFDSISGFQDIGLDDLWETIIIESPRRKRYGLDKGDYGINMQRLSRFVRNIVALSDIGDFNFGITAWPAELSPSPEDDEVPEKLMPWVQGKNMASKICGYMNIIGFGDIDEKGRRRLRFMESDRYYAKTQFDDKNGPGTWEGAKYQVVNPSMKQIIEISNKSGFTGDNHKGPSKRPLARATKAKPQNKKVVFK